MILKSLIKLIFICLITLNISCDKQHQSKKNVLTIAVASNMQFAIKDIVKEYTKLKDVDCDVIIGSSGKLTTQITKGAPFDIFLSANMKYPLELCSKDMTYHKKPKIYAYGKMVLWSCDDNILLNLDSLNNKQIKHIGIANPKTAPYGISAMEVISKLKIENDITPKLIYGESISQINQFVSLKTVELGFTSKSTVLSPQMNNKGKWVDVDQNLYTPIKQGVVMIQNNHNVNSNTLDFYTFLSSSKAIEILKSYGYGI